MMPRRKVSLLAAETFNMKHSAAAAFGGGAAGGVRKNGKFSVFVLVFSALLFFTFLYNGEDVKPIAAEHPLGSGGGGETPAAELTRVVEARTGEADKEEEAAAVVVDVRVAVEPLLQPPVEKEQEAEAEAEAEEAKVQEKAEAEESRVPEKAEAATVTLPEEKRERVVLDVPESCDLFDGQWVRDEVSYPIYKEPECGFLTEQVTCMRNGRRDDRFQNWRWQPNHCNLPRFDAKIMLERLRGKRLMFVGDSLNRNQWESMVCLVQSAVPWNRKSLTKNGNLNIFRIEDYNATVEFYWAPFLVESNSDDPRIHSISERIIMPKSIAKHGQNWKNVDYLVFNTYIWWCSSAAMKVLKGSFAEGSTEYDEVDRPLAYRRVLSTWSKWVEKNVNPNRTMVFFMSMSPNHFRSAAWGNPNGIKCALETEPVAAGNLSRPLDVGTDWRLFAVAENVIRNVRRVPVSFVKITALSEYRKDAHTSVHTLRQGKLLTPEQQADPANFADCLHWCLPGVPDTWNEFLYARIASRPWHEEL